MLNNSNKLPFFGFGTSNGRDDNHNDKSNTSFYTKDSSIAALEAFQRDYLPSASAASGAAQRLPSVSLSSLSSLRPPSPPSPGPRPPSSSPSLGHLGHQSHAFDEQFKDLYEIDDNPRRTEFLDDLFSFMQKRGTPINRLPVMAKGVLDLFELYNLVCEKGGLVEVINKKQWQEIIRDLKLPSSITSAAFTLRTQYTRYLYPYECKMKNLSKPSDLTVAVEGHRREARRGYDEAPLMFPGPGGPGPFSYPGFPALPGLGEAGARLPLAGLLPPGLANPLDPVTRLTLMKIMGQQNPGAMTSLSSLLPPSFSLPKPESRTSMEEKLSSPSASPSKLTVKEGKQRSEDEASLDEEEKKKMIVCIEINSIKYQGILFAQPPPVKNVIQS